ncbi:MAG TPA: hypothetical protein VHE12_05440 [bacterium]|nr:hypothetical protein [bacterium]
MKKLALILCLVSLAGCSTLKDFAKALTLSKCEYRLVSVSDVAIAGIGLQGKTSLSQFDAMTLFKLQRALSSGALSLTFTLNLEGRNPNDSPAAMGHFAWILEIDGSELTRGDFARSIQIPAQGGVAPIPLAVSLDLNRVLTGKTLDSMLNLALNVAGEGTHPTHVSLKLKPSVQVSGHDLDYPDYITLSQDFGER